MRILQQSEQAINFSKQLLQGRAMTLPASSGARRIRVTEGKLWLTLTSTDERLEADRDEWLLINDTFDLSAKQTAVIEAWPNARFEVLASVSAG